MQCAATVVKITVCMLMLVSKASAGESHGKAIIHRGAIVKSEFIYDKAPFPSCHASTIAQTEKGLIVAWFGGTREKHRDVGIWVSVNNGDGWTDVVQVADGVADDGKEYPCWNPVLFQPEDGPVMLFYKVGPSPRGWWGMLTTSNDGGATWSEHKRLPEGIWGPIKNKPVALPDGSILCPTSGEATGWQVFLQKTTDLGETWQTIGPLNDGKKFAAIQPTVLLHGGGSIQLLCRSRQGVITQCWSKDNGRTWGEMTRSPLPNPNSGIDAVTLSDGRQLLVYNHTTVRKGKWGGPRTPLNIAVSSDGKRWNAALILEDEEGEYSYPAVIQVPGGAVHITYTWKRKKVKHVVLDPDKLVCRPIVDGKWPTR